ncbi:MAG: hypothetical protein Q8Q09_26225 [Deltaproteobacteria bacterium]|nr:hypothetical protein [Deltaproteobacteria bacterium]
MRQITFEDMCHLQSYFDQRGSARSSAFHSLEESSSETTLSLPDETGDTAPRRVTLGEGVYEVSERRTRERLALLLREEYQNLPAINISDPELRVRLRVSWWAARDHRRLRPEEPVLIETRHGNFSIPATPCLGELMFGSNLYIMRRRFLDDDNARAVGRDAPSFEQALTQAHQSESPPQSVPSPSAATDASAPQDASVQP